MKFMKLKTIPARRAGVWVLCVALLAACGGEGDGSGGRGSRSGSVDLVGAGATFPYPLYSQWMAEYARKTGVRINYQSIGSGGGVRQLSEGTVDFGATDGPMTDEEMSRAKGGEIMHVPTILGAVVIAYNLPEVRQPLRLTGEVIADIYLGRITTWNDARIATLNPGVALPSRDILPVHRSDGSGTTYIFTDYLSTVSPAWRSGPGRGKDVGWPSGVGLGAKGNEGVTGQVGQTRGAVGYVELAYARQNKLQVAHIRNAAGNFVEPTVESITAAASGAMERLGPESDYRVSIVNAPGEQAYPIASFTWIILYKDQQNAEKGRKLVDFLRWALTEGQRSAAALHYAPLPDTLREQLLQRLDSVRVGGQG